MSQEQTTSYQDRYVQLVKEITTLQWVRESLPSHSKYYEGLKKKLEKQIHLKAFSERELENYRLGKDYHSSNASPLQLRSMFNSSSNNSSKSSYSNVIESVRFYENAIQELEAQIDQAKIMMDELNVEKRRLDDLCTELHTLYDQVIIPDSEDVSYVFGQHLKSDVEQLALDIPDIKSKIDTYKIAQAKLYEARELIETAMKSLPGASTFMDRQAIVASSSNNSHSLFGKAAAISTSFMDPIKKADKIAQESYQLVLEASKICPDVPNIPNQQYKANESNVILYLTGYRGYRLKIESTLRTRVNPRLHGFENQLNMAKYHFEQRTIEWIDHQIITLEAHLRTNGCLVNENLDREISMLRMGSRAAIAAVAEETSARVTVDDALDISTDDGGPLPEYQSDGSTTSSSSGRNSTDETMGVVEPPHPNHCDHQNSNLPSYAINNNNQLPPAYTR